MCTKLSLSRRLPYRVPTLIARPGLTSPSDLKPPDTPTSHPLPTKWKLNLTVSEDLRCFKC